MTACGISRLHKLTKDITPLPTETVVRTIFVDTAFDLSHVDSKTFQVKITNHDIYDKKIDVSEFIDLNTYY